MKPRIAFLYRKSNKKFQTSYRVNTQIYNFYLKALPRNPDIELQMIPENNEFDALTLEGKCDALLLFDIISWGGPDRIKNLDKVSYLKVLNCGDCHQANRVTVHTKGRTKVDFCRDAQIDYYHWHHPSPYFHKFWPKDWKYWQIQVGVEKSVYQSVKPFSERISDRILNSGVLSKNIYVLRKLANTHPSVYHNPHRGRKSVVGDDYVELLERYKAVVSACTTYTVMKYIEGCAAGCLNFMEVTPQNCGTNLGFVDGESAVFINNNNYRSKFDEFISESDNPKWESIAANGRKYVMSHFTNDHTVADLVSKIKEALESRTL